MVVPCHSGELAVMVELYARHVLPMFIMVRDEQPTAADMRDEDTGETAPPELRNEATAIPAIRFILYGQGIRVSQVLFLLARRRRGYRVRPYSIKTFTSHSSRHRTMHHAPS